MSEGYREDTRDEIGSREGSRHDGDVGIDRDDLSGKMSWKKWEGLRTSTLR